MKAHEKARCYIKGTGLKQKIVAEKAGYTERQFSAIMLGRRIMYADDIERICKALGVTPNDLLAFGKSEASKPPTQEKKTG